MREACAVTRGCQSSPAALVQLLARGSACVDERPIAVSGPGLSQGRSSEGELPRRPRGAHQHPEALPHALVGCAGRAGDTCALDCLVRCGQELSASGGGGRRWAGQGAMGTVQGSGQCHGHGVRPPSIISEVGRWCPRSHSSNAQSDLSDPACVGGAAAPRLL
eukprot:7747887-Alexandrium_andersonii.AAC.1